MLQVVETENSRCFNGYVYYGQYSPSFHSGFYRNMHLSCELADRILFAVYLTFRKTYICC